MALIKRQISQELISLAGQFPVVTILGPRQAGKTTLARSCFSDYEYINLELPHIRKAAQDDPTGFFKMRSGPMILDEIQRVPELLSYVQVLSDEHKKKGEFILTGSHQPKLAENISQSLAGRTGLLTLLPLSIPELESAHISYDRDENIHNGFMPGVHFDGINPNAFYRAYFQTYVERDVKMLINVSNQNAFETFVRLLAGRVGQVVNLNSFAGDVGVSSTTLAAWLSVLEASYIVFRIPCFFNNFGKRLIKSPKIYFHEVGLAAWLLGIEKAEQVARDPLIGGLFENMVVLEALKARYNTGREKGLFFFRDKTGLEVDLLALRGRDIMPVEIKSGMTYDRSFSKNLISFQKIADNTVAPALVYAGEESIMIDGVTCMNYKQLYETIAAWDSDTRA
jgi:predicted AAA+ superfamily ATPase